MIKKTFKLKLTLSDSGISTDPVHGKLTCTDPNDTVLTEEVDTTSEEQAITYVLKALAVRAPLAIDLYEEAPPVRTESKDKGKGKNKGKGGK